MRRRPTIDTATAERLVAGSVEPDDVPPGLEQVAGIVRAARAAGAEHELAGRGAVVAEMSLIASGGAVVAPDVPCPGAGAGPGRTRRTATGAGLAVVVALGLVGAAAAATAVVGPRERATTTTTVATTRPDAGDLRSGGSPAGQPQDASPERSEGSDRSSEGVAPPAPVGPDPVGAASRGLCTAFGARDQLPGASVAAAELAAAAAAAGQSIEQFCAEVDDPNDTTTTMPPAAPDVRRGVPSTVPRASPGGAPEIVPTAPGSQTRPGEPPGAADGGRSAAVPPAERTAGPATGPVPGRLPG